MVTGIIVTHGMLAEELLQTAKRIIGEFSDCYSVTNIAKSPQALSDELASIISSCRDEPCMVFVDFFFGSCGYACMKLLGSFTNIRVVSGVNLPMLLAFLNKRGDVPFEQLPQEIVERGRDSIRELEREGL
jgi:mannose/fructose-specific phosphotransferase system component IIA